MEVPRDQYLHRKQAAADQIPVQGAEHSLRGALTAACVDVALRCKTLVKLVTGSVSLLKAAPGHKSIAVFEVSERIRCALRLRCTCPIPCLFNTTIKQAYCNFNTMSYHTSNTIQCPPIPHLCPMYSLYCHDQFTTIS